MEQDSQRFVVGRLGINELPRWLPENFDWPAPSEYLINFKKTFHFEINVVRAITAGTHSITSKNNNTLVDIKGQSW